MNGAFTRLGYNISFEGEKVIIAKRVGLLKKIKVGVLNNDFFHA